MHALCRVPDLGYVSAILIGFLLGAEFDVLAFLIKRYYGTPRAPQARDADRPDRPRARVNRPAPSVA